MNSRGTGLRAVSAALAMGAALALTACAADAPLPSAPTSAASRLYVSVGDSYAAGYQPAVPTSSTGTGTGTAQHAGTSRTGFAYRVQDRLTATGRPVQLVNFACSGATSATVLSSRGCAAGALGPGALGYPGTTQAEQTERFLRAHRGQVDLVTVSLGGNDVAACVQPDGQSPRQDSVCVARALTQLSTNLSTLLTGLRQAAGADVPIVGLTYPDIYLAAYLPGRGGDVNLAQGSLVLFRDQFNPVLRAAYEHAGGRFVDVTAAAGAYLPLSSTTTLPTYGPLPTAVANICSLTYYCTLGDLHPTAQGHALIADEVLKTVGAQ